MFRFCFYSESSPVTVMVLMVGVLKEELSASFGFFR
jgi:hypothetical protein